MGGSSRFAIYYAPSLADPLWARGAIWLGRDPETGAPLPQPPIPGIADATADPRKYGFHATLKPPMRLAPGATFAELEARVRVVAQDVPSFALPPLAVADVKGFLALREKRLSPELQNLSDAFVAGVDVLRDPPDDAEFARRRHARLTPQQDTNLVRWGYPYVFDTWFFHMTLTRRLPPEAQAVFRPAAEAHFAAALALDRRVDDVCVFSQAAPDAPFQLSLRVPLRGATR